MSVRPVSGINLASDPFRRERAQNAAFALICLALTCFLLVILGLILQSRSQASRIRAEITQEQSELQGLQREQARYQAVLGKPSNAGIFARSVFLNELIARRALSWTRVFDDLGTVMPAAVRLEVVRLPQIPSQQAGEVNRVQLDLTLGADHPEGVIQFLRNLQKSSLFGPPTVVNQSPPTQNDPLYRYRVTVSYGQKL